MSSTCASSKRCTSPRPWRPGSPGRPTKPRPRKTEGNVRPAVARLMSMSALAVEPADNSAVSVHGDPTIATGPVTREEIDREFREFVTGRSPALLRTAYLLGGDWATAEDLLQVALTKTYLAWLRLGTIEAIEPYARRVLVNTATSWWRRRWHGERPTEVLPDTPASDGLDERLERDRLWRHVITLPTRQR